MNSEDELKFDWTFNEATTTKWNDELAQTTIIWTIKVDNFSNSKESKKYLGTIEINCH